MSLTGAELPGCQGRLQNPGSQAKRAGKNSSKVGFLGSLLTNTTHANPGHALEAGWFLLQFAGEDKELQKIAVDKFVELPYEHGWDNEHGGLFYFLDVDGLCPTQVSLPPLPLIRSCYSGVATRQLSIPSANKRCCFPGTAGMEHEAVVASL